jgi:hypothetical protein
MNRLVLKYFNDPDYRQPAINTPFPIKFNRYERNKLHQLLQNLLPVVNPFVFSN